MIGKFQRRAEEVCLLIREAFSAWHLDAQVGRVIGMLTGEVVSAQTGEGETVPWCALLMGKAWIGLSTPQYGTILLGADLVSRLTPLFGHRLARYTRMVVKNAHDTPRHVSFVAVHIPC